MNVNLAAAWRGHLKGLFKMLINTRYVENSRPYLGPELRPHFLLTQLQMKGSALAAWVGPCDVKTEHLVDWEDRLANDSIKAEKMIHFLGEFFGITLREGVFLQRLLMSIMREVLTDFLRDEVRISAAGLLNSLRRDGDDLFLLERKLSVSIVTASPVSVLLHAGINVDPSGAPVPAIGLDELKIDAARFAKEVLKRFENEWQSIEWACTKVRPVV